MDDALIDNVANDYGRRFAKMAIKVASKSRHKQHRLGAVLVRGGNIISCGHNFSHIHAENTVINRAWRTSTEGAVLIIVRVRRDGTLGMSKPCPMCVDRLIEAGIRRVIYSDEYGNFRHMKLPSKLEYNCGCMTTKLQTMLWYKKEAA